MNYYDENDDRPKLYGGVATALYCIALAAAMAWVQIAVPVQVENEMLIIEIEEVEREQPKPVVTAQAPRHENLSSTKQNSQQVTGTDEQTRTVNGRRPY